ncbi:hypothetical protein BDV18DRAFT_162014 [Aspergillus unguis]
MPEETQQAGHHSSSFMDKILHPQRHKGEEHAAKDKAQDSEGGLRSDLKKDEEGMKQYLKKDEELEREGQTYGGLM